MLDKHLRYFIEVAEVKNYTRAAENLFISQSTVSKAVASLEKELNIQLIEVKGGNFFLTEAGEIFYKFAKDVTGYYDRREKELYDKIKILGEDLNLGLPPTAGSIYFSNKITEFSKKHPEINLNIVNVTSKYIPDMLLNGSLDLGIVIEPFNDKRFVKKIAYQSEAVLIVSSEHRLAKKDFVDFSELKDEKFLQISKEYMYYELFKDYCKKAGFEPNIIFENFEWDMILEMVVANRGVTILPLPLVKKYLSSRAKYLHLKNPEFPRALTIIYPKTSFVKKSMKSFIEICT
jgi:DNA-binding transcriptional LysR family regulator